MGPQDQKDSSRNFFRVPCEFQIRYRKIDADDLKIFESFALRPSPHSTMRTDVQNQLRLLDIQDGTKFLLERAFQLLMNIDQRLERLEERYQNAVGGEVNDLLSNYEWTHGDLGAGGLSFRQDGKIDLATNDNVLVDLILSSVPEHRLVASAKVVHVGAGGALGFEFVAIHDDDREFIHQYVRDREREILRERALERQKASSSQEPPKQ